MIYLAWLFRAMFCKHKFDYHEVQYTERTYGQPNERNGIKVSATCKNCGWHRSYWKH